MVTVNINLKLQDINVQSYTENIKRNTTNVNSGRYVVGIKY